MSTDTPTSELGTPAALEAVPAVVAAVQPHTQNPKIPDTTPLLDGYSGLNPIVRAATPLLDLVSVLQHSAAPADGELFRSQLMHAIKDFERTLDEQRMSRELIQISSYALCTFLDEVISGTPWGGNGMWARRSLLVAFHNEAEGGEQVFQILQRLSQTPQPYLEVLELIYLCLALGFVGRYRVLDNGKEQLDAVRENLQKLIAAQRGPFEPELALHWRGSAQHSNSAWKKMPIWGLAALCACLLVMVHFFLNYFLRQEGNPVIVKMQQAALTATRAAPATLPPRLPVLLAQEIERDWIGVDEQTGKTIITLRDGLFASGSADVIPAALPVFERIGQALKVVPGQVQVTGYTDNQVNWMARKNDVGFNSNLQLSMVRAAKVANFLASQAGPASRYSYLGKGDADPVAPNDTPLNRARNRRVEIVVLTPTPIPK